MGHMVHPRLPEIVLSQPTKILTFLREPWGRLQSDFHYFQSKPFTGHLGSNVNNTLLLQKATDLLAFATYPGLPNCATKVCSIDIPFKVSFVALIHVCIPSQMLNGFQCGDDVILTEAHLHIAKEYVINYVSMFCTVRNTYYMYVTIQYVSPESM